VGAAPKNIGDVRDAAVMQKIRKSFGAPSFMLLDRSEAECCQSDIATAGVVTRVIHVNVLAVADASEHFCVAIADSMSFSSILALPRCRIIRVLVGVCQRHPHVARFNRRHKMLKVLTLLVAARLERFCIASQA